MYTFRALNTTVSVRPVFFFFRKYIFQNLPQNLVDVGQIQIGVFCFCFFLRLIPTEDAFAIQVGKFRDCALATVGDTKPIAVPLSFYGQDTCWITCVPPMLMFHSLSDIFNESLQQS